VELEQQLGRLFAEAALEHVEPLDHRRLDFFVGPAAEDRAQLLFDLALARQLVRQPITNAGGQSHGAPSRTSSSPTIATSRSRTRRSADTARCTVEPLM